MIAQIVPLLKMSKGLGSFSYAVPLELQKEIQIGQIVQVNFRNIKTNGLVVGLENGDKKKFKFKIKEIEKIITPLPIITQKQINLIDYLANYYGLAKGLVARSVTQSVKVSKEIEGKNRKTKKHASLKVLKQKNKKIKKQLFWYENENEVMELIRKNARQVLKNKGQMLILVPEIEMIEKIALSVKIKEEEVVKIHSRLKMSEYNKSWQEILVGESKIIIGTKIAVLWPFVNLQKIIIFNEHDWNHKQSDINPRYDSRVVAEWLAYKHQSELILTTAAPAVETYTRVVIPKKVEKNILLADLKQERLGGNYGPISDKLLASIKEKLACNQKIFLFHNRTGFAKFIQCHDCEYVFKCPKCQATLNYENKDKQLICAQCGYREDMPPFCPKCSGVNINFKGAGTQKIKSELQKMLPEVLIKETDKKAGKNIEQAQIIIATKFALNKIDLKQFALIGFVNFDQLLNVPDFRAGEKAYQLFYEILAQNIEADYIIQTNDPENYVLQSIGQNRPEIFYEKELAVRQDFEYPPFKQLVKITAQDKKEKLVLNTLKKVSQIVTDKWPKIKMQGPIINNPPKVRGNYKYHLILKMPMDFDFQKVWPFLPDNVIIDINPERVN